MISLIHPWYNKERNIFTVKDNSNRWEVDVLHKIPDSEVKTTLCTPYRASRDNNRIKTSNCSSGLMVIRIVIIVVQRTVLPH